MNKSGWKTRLSCIFSWSSSASKENQRHLHPYVISVRRPTGFNPRPEDSPHQNAKLIPKITLPLCLLQGDRLYVSGIFLAPMRVHTHLLAFLPSFNTRTPQSAAALARPDLTGIRPKI
jgi:hypothetical protein